MGIQGLRVLTKNNIEIWTRPILSKSKYSFAVAFVSLRTDGQPFTITLNLTDINLKNDNGYYQYVSKWNGVLDIFMENQ